MAGSYRHITDRNGNFIGVKLLDNLGDAHEALEECYLMIQQLTGRDKQKIFEAWLNGYFKQRRPLGNLSLATYDRFWEIDV